MKICDYLHDWLALRTLAPSTASGYRRTITNHINPIIGQLPINQVTPAHVMNVLAPLMQAGHTRAAQLTRILLRCALQDALRMGLIDRNPVDAIRAPQHRKQPIAYWTADQIRQFLQAQRFSSLYHCWLLALVCGLRRGELLGLRWEDVTADQITIRNQRMVIDRQTIDKPPKSAAGNRTIPLPAVVAAALRAERRRSRSLYVLSHPDGSPYSPQQLRRALDAACTASRLPPLHIHGLRHSMATAALDAGTDIKVLQVILGHAHYSTTADTYLHPSRAAQANAVANLARFVV